MMTQPWESGVLCGSFSTMPQSPWSGEGDMDYGMSLPPIGLINVLCDAGERNDETTMTLILGMVQACMTRKVVTLELEIQKEN